jgi:hypothetical protein
MSNIYVSLTLESLYLCVSYGSYIKLFPQTALTGWSL